ncbi:isopentenyl-diphosphate Delta-isomerase [Rhodobacteraceae bacterium XHP0102]|nr:isopentenyl-diphosphate Delta-isomerase [Rhodobacteraceae bacterium XHP0102]
MDDVLIPAWVGGELTAVDKLEVHQRGLRHKAISVFLMRANKVLMQRRALTKYHTPGLWTNTCCTHPHWGEDALSCAQRRLGEELGLPTLSLEKRDRVEYRADVGGGLIEHELVDIFVGELPPEVEPTPNPNEVADLAWIDLAGLSDRVAASPEKFTPWLKIYLEDHAAKIFGIGAKV